VLAMDPRVADAVWAAIHGHLPPRPPDTHPLGCHRRRIADRDCFDGILIRLVTGCSWDVAARLCKASETTLRARRTQWLAAGVFDKLVEEAIAGYDKIIGLDLSEVAVDGSLHKAPCGGEGTGPNPTDRAKIGWKWSVATDLFGIPIGWVIDGANRNDSVLLEPTLQAVATRGLLLDLETLHLDRGYDSFLTTQRCHGLRRHRHRLRQKETQRRDQSQDQDQDDDEDAGEDEEAHPGPALARGAHQLLVLKFWPAPPQHRPLQQTTTRTGRPRRRPHPDRETRQMGQTMDRLDPPIRARSYSWTVNTATLGSSPSATSPWAGRRGRTQGRDRPLADPSPDKNTHPSRQVRASRCGVAERIRRQS
jgi:hypothetical protein